MWNEVRSCPMATGDEVRLTAAPTRRIEDEP
ncbi:hypothetical protein OJF2_73130 [Aquisphaera giovannonii]|uniref:Uncharacterized protein n=1 Tax=Aquisphaera giovannonii TaxID=406548 RepID=A0A5B9WDV2_9BACT|nr:hypothetical protein OJF2_73130 [Aquisphaera giovannonii]